MSKLYVVGDSTVAKFNDVSYFYPRYGYGAVLDKYFDIEIINLALSGRSSKSYVFDPEYKTLLSSVSQGDFVLIGFGHNDEKNDDAFRFTSANGDINDKNSFKYSLYNNYIKPIIDRGATPILTTPIIRLSPNDIYENEIIHQTIDGDYKNAIIELANYSNILSIDLTKASLDYAIKHKYKDLLIYHAITKGKMVDNKLVYDDKSVDKTHLSYLGALYSAYYIALGIKNSNLELKKYLKEIIEPKDSDLEINPLYKYIPYITPELANYKPSDNFIADEYYGTAFGVIDTNNPVDAGYIAKGNKTYYVGQHSDKCFGKINASTEGFALLFKRIKKSDNFKFSAKCKVIECANVRQAAFGLMLRGDAYINQKSNMNIVTNYIASGLITTDKVTYASFCRESSTDLKRVNPVGEFFYEKGDELELSIERLGQVVKTKVIYKNKEYNDTFTDFDYYNDQDYLFVGMFGTNGTIVEFSDVKFEITGKAIEA